MTDTLPMPVTALSSSQQTSILNLVRRTAKAEILPRFRSMSGAEIETKTGPEDLVTEADKAAEKMIARGLLRMFPNALIIGEEDVAANPDILDKIATAETTFTIDPVDGTANYAQGLSMFGVILSMLRFGKPVFGLHYDPLLDDVVVADLDNDTRLLRPRRAARPLRTSAGGPVEELRGYIPLYLVPDDMRARVATTYARFRRINSLRCSCHEYRQLAAGHVEFILGVNMTAWDHAAGVLLAQKAGGHAAFLDGQDYTAARREGYLLVASDVATWGRVRDVFDFLLLTQDGPEAGHP